MPSIFLSTLVPAPAKHSVKMWLASLKIVRGSFFPLKVTQVIMVKHFNFSFIAVQDMFPRLRYFSLTIFIHCNLFFLVTFLIMNFSFLSILLAHVSTGPAVTKSNFILVHHCTQGLTTLVKNHNALPRIWPNLF